VSSGTIRIVALAVILAGCVSGKPLTFGEYSGLAPRVAPQKGERIPQHLTVELGRPANVAVFLVVPGRGSQLLFPADSTQTEFIEAGTHLVTTSAGRNALSDTSRLIRLPNQMTRQPGRGGRISRDTTTGQLGVIGRGYLLMYASQEPLPYSILSTKVSGLSIPIDDGDALNTVTKLIRSTTHTIGPWAAYATDFPP
jgi:hypothetical protein